MVTIHACPTCCCEHSCSLNSRICIITTIVIILSNFYIALSILFCHFDNVFKCYLLKLINTFWATNLNSTCVEYKVRF